MNVLTSERRVTRSISKKIAQPTAANKNQWVVIPQTTASSFRHQPSAPHVYELSKRRETSANNDTTSKVEDSISKAPPSAHLKPLSSIAQTPETLSEKRQTPSSPHDATDPAIVTLDEFSKCSSSQTVDRIDSVFQCKELLGEGTYGVVYRSIRRETKEVVALKRLHESTNEGVPATSTREVLLLQKLDHPNIVKLKEVVIETRRGVPAGKHPRLWLEFEYCELDIKKYMKMFNNRRMPLATIRSVIFQLLQGLAYCHERGIVHRDLKPNNILLRIKQSTRGANKRPALETIKRSSLQRRRTKKEFERREQSEDTTTEKDQGKSPSYAENSQAIIEKCQNTELELGQKCEQKKQQLNNSITTGSGSTQVREQSQPNTPAEQFWPNHQFDASIPQTVEIKIADFGLARFIPYPLTPMTHEVVTLWYRAPEVLLGLPEYTKAIDLWSVGCCLVELLYGRPLFAGDTEIDTLFKIFRFLGTPNPSVWPNVMEYKYYHNAWPAWPRRVDRYDWLRENEEINVECKDLIDRLLCYDYRCRITCEEAIRHPWFSSLKKNNAS